jgi:hypothetical protein
MLLLGNATIAERLQQLTQNTTINELFGMENIQDKQTVANKEQFKPLTLDKLRTDIIAEIQKETIENS